MGAIDREKRSVAHESPASDGEAHKVLWYLSQRLAFDRYSVVDISEASWDLSLKSEVATRALNALIEDGIVERGPRVGKRHSFRFARAPGHHSSGPCQPLGSNP